VFDAARLLSRCNGRGALVFIDEIDALASQRTGNDDKMARRSGIVSLRRPCAEMTRLAIATNAGLDCPVLPSLAHRASG